jgi:hypothetical protein
MAATSIQSLARMRNTQRDAQNEAMRRMDALLREQEESSVQDREESASLMQTVRTTPCLNSGVSTLCSFSFYVFLL